MKSMEISYSLCGNNLEEGGFISPLTGRPHELAGEKKGCQNIFTSYLKYNQVVFSPQII